MNYIRKHWRGELSLAISFWVNVFLINLIIVFLNKWFTQSSPINHPVIAARASIIIVVLNLFIYAWQIVGLWRACNRHVDVNGRAFWARTAQIIVVLGLIATLGNINSYWGIYKELYQLGFQKDTTPDYSLTLKNNDSLIHLEGGLRFGVSKDVAALLKDHPDMKGIILDSVGGRTYEGQELSKLILVYGLDTYSLKGCYSAGTMAFISGTNRFLGIGANLGFHQYHTDYENLDEFVDLKEAQDEDLRIFKRKGIKREFLEKLYDTSPEDLWYPSIDELLSAGVIHGVVNPSDLTPVEYQESIEDVNVKEIFLDMPVYRTIQKYEPKVFEQIMVDMDEQIKKGATLLELTHTISDHIAVLASRTISKSSDEALFKYIQALLNSLRKLVEKDPFLCLKYLYPQQYGTFLVSEYLSNEEMELMNDALNNIIIDAYEKENPPVDIEAAELQRQKIMLQLGDDAKYIDIDLKELQNSDQYKRHCDAMIRTYDIILTEDRKFAANILRYMFTQDESDEGKYVGDIVDGIKHGYGTMTYLDGRKYVGEFKNDNLDGQGRHTWPEGDVYVGEWKDNVRNGQGTQVWPSGDKYVGEWENDESTGLGTYSFSNGEKYVGEFRNNMAVGGWYYWTDGSREWAYTDSQGNWKFQTEADRKRSEITRKDEFSHERQSSKELQEENKKLGLFSSGMIVSGREYGININDITQGCPAWDAGLSTGDIIVEIEGEEIKSLEGYVEIMQKLNKTRRLEIALVVNRRDVLYDVIIKRPN
ncbi:MAG: PDZ domain-containing protein [Candidatus Scalindua sediminis]|nr:PDZ domain-containing protein [Candidatus Scalindua sediminis]